MGTRAMPVWETVARWCLVWGHPLLCPREPHTLILGNKTLCLNFLCSLSDRSGLQVVITIPLLQIGC